MCVQTYHDNHDREIQIIEKKKRGGKERENKLVKLEQGSEERGEYAAR